MGTPTKLTFYKHGDIARVQKGQNRRAIVNSPSVVDAHEYTYNRRL